MIVVEYLVTLTQQVVHLWVTYWPFYLMLVVCSAAVAGAAS